MRREDFIQSGSSSAHRLQGVVDRACHMGAEMNKDMENTFNQMAELGGSDERIGQNTATVINAPLLPKNTRPTPAATDTGLETCVSLHITPTDSYPDVGVEVHNGSYIQPKDSPVAMVTRSQAEELLTAERARAAEKERLRFEGDLDKWMKIIGAGITGYQPEAYTLMDFACEELVKLRADNAKLTARVKELDRCHEGTIDLCNQKTAEIKALEAKLAAARKALEPFADHANDRAVDDTGWRDKETVKIVVSIGDLRKARALLGGKPEGRKSEN